MTQIFLLQRKHRAHPPELRKNLRQLFAVQGLGHTVEQFRFHPIEGSGALTH